MQKKNMKELLIGAHTSTAGGLHNALYEGQEIGATTVQLFTGNLMNWDNQSISKTGLTTWFKALEETGMRKVMSHSSYLMNLGSSDPARLRRHLKAFREELERCHLLKIPYVCLHVGKARGFSEEECLDTVVHSLLGLEKTANAGNTRILLETSAGQGTNVGYTFEQLAYVFDRARAKIPLGICMDTCHLFSAGYDVKTKAGWDQTLKAFDQCIGFKHLHAIHANDSKDACSSCCDRHAPLGKGKIGLECFRYIMTHPKLRELPKYLETRGGPALWKKEIAMLRKFGTC